MDPTAEAQARPVGLSDLAHRLGVSAMTVSRALNDQPGVGAATRAKVMALAAELGYRPNASARALVTGRTSVVGMISFDVPYYGPGSVLDGTARAARRLGYSLRMATVDSTDGTSPDELIHQLIGEGVAGLIVAAPHRWAAAALQRLPPRMPAVAIDVERPQRLAPVVGLVQAPGARAATEHLLALGHERVWHLAGPATWDSSRLRERGWREAHAAAGRTPPRVMRGDWTARSGYELGRRLALRPEVTAVFAANDQMAVGALRALREAGRDVPGDVSLVGYDDIPEAAYLWPPLTTVRQGFGAAGRRALDLLAAQLEGVPCRPEVHPVGTDLVIRDSSAPPRGPRPAGAEQ